MFKLAVHQLYSNHPDPTIACDTENTVDKNGLEVSFFYKVYMGSDKLFTINMYNTKCKILVNGKNELTFINDHLPLIQSLISKLESSYDSDMISALNTMLRNTLIKMNNFENKSTAPDSKCPICKQNVRSRAVQCEICNLWIHYKCEKLSDKIIHIIETPDNVYLFRCKQCTDQSEYRAIEYEHSHEYTHTDTDRETSETVPKSIDDSTDSIITAITEQPHSGHSSDDSLSYHSPEKTKINDTDRLKVTIDIDNALTDNGTGGKENKTNKTATANEEHIHIQEIDNHQSTTLNDEIKINGNSEKGEKNIIKETSKTTTTNEKHIQDINYQQNNTDNDDIKSIENSEKGDNIDESEQTETKITDTEYIQETSNQQNNRGNENTDSTCKKGSNSNTSDHKSDEQYTNPILLNIIKSLDQNMTIMTECIINNSTHNSNTQTHQVLLDKLDTCANKMEALTSEVTKLVNVTSKAHNNMDKQTNQITVLIDKIDTNVITASQRNQNSMLKCLQSIDEKLTESPDEKHTQETKSIEKETNDSNYIIGRIADMENRLKILELQQQLASSQKISNNVHDVSSLTKTSNGNQSTSKEQYIHRATKSGPPNENTHTYMDNSIPSTSAETHVTSHENSHLKFHKQTSAEISASQNSSKVRPNVTYSEITKGYKTKTSTGVRKVRGKDDPLSNLFMPANKIKYCGIWYTSSEQAYQSKKCEDHGRKDLKEKIMNSNDTMNIMKIGQKITTTRDFKVSKRDLMKSILKEKYQYSEEFREALHQTGNCKIIEDTSHPFWGARANGLNIHGKVLMEIRDNPPEIIHTEKVTNVKPNTNDVLCLVDSNGYEVDYKRTWPYHNTRVRKATTIPKATEAVDNDKGREPDIVCIHTGTNDLISNDNAAGDYIDLTNKIKQKWPNAKLLISKLLPRGGQSISKKVKLFNNSIENHFLFDINSQVIDHSDLQWGDAPNKDYYLTERNNSNGDPKPLLHLNKSGLSVLASKFRFAMKKL